MGWCFRFSFVALVFVLWLLVSLRSLFFSFLFLRTVFIFLVRSRLSVFTLHKIGINLAFFFFGCVSCKCATSCWRCAAAAADHFGFLLASCALFCFSQFHRCRRTSCEWTSIGSMNHLLQVYFRLFRRRLSIFSCAQRDRFFGRLHDHLFLFSRSFLSLRLLEMYVSYIETINSIAQLKISKMNFFKSVIIAFQQDFRFTTNQNPIHFDCKQCHFVIKNAWQRNDQIEEWTFDCS